MDVWQGRKIVFGLVLEPEILRPGNAACWGSGEDLSTVSQYGGECVRREHTMSGFRAFGEHT